MKKLFGLFFALTIFISTSCGSDHFRGRPGEDGLNAYIIASVDSALCNGLGGLRLRSYLDKNRNGQHDDEEIAAFLGVVCNGDTGAAGNNGADGIAGVNGVDGATGAIGPIGPQGAQGIAGIDGIDGLPGAQGIQGTQGVPGPIGPQGTPGPAGAIGATGPTGPQGEPGAQGLRGLPGTSGNTISGATPVQLCPTDNATFPEFGFVIGDSIYAVYYGKVNGVLNSFLARLSAGSYVTTNDDTPCAFTVSYANGHSYINGNQVDPTIVSASAISFVSQAISTDNYNCYVDLTLKNNSSYTLSNFAIDVTLSISGQVVTNSYFLTGASGSSSGSGNTRTFTTSGGLAPGSSWVVRLQTPQANPASCASASSITTQTL